MCVFYIYINFLYVYPIDSALWRTLTNKKGDLHSHHYRANLQYL